MRAEDVKLGAVYRFSGHGKGGSAGQIFAVVKLLEGRYPGAHMRLTLSGTTAGRLRESDHPDGPYPWKTWADFEIMTEGR